MSKQLSGGKRIFISYSRANWVEVSRFAQALIRAGIEIWIDQDDIDPLDPFPARIREGLASSHALLAWYSPEYAESAYCQEELTAAWIYAQSVNVLSRIFVLNPLETVSHICLGDVARQNFLQAPRDDVSAAVMIGTIRQKLACLDETLSGVGRRSEPDWIPPEKRRTCSNRFVGRLKDLWIVHTALNQVQDLRKDNPIAQLHGLGGIGKTLLAIEYATRFGSSYPGGIYWLDARGDTYVQQIETIASCVGVSVAGRMAPQLRLALGETLKTRGKYLWIVDDLPPGMEEQSFLAWCAPGKDGCTLITTRTIYCDSIGKMLPVLELDVHHALRLLTQERTPQSDVEWDDAKALAEDLGRHPQALDVAGHYLLKSRDFGQLRNAVMGPTGRTAGDPLGELAASLEGELPNGHEKSIVATLLASVSELGEQGQNLLRVACELRGGTLITMRLASDVFRRAFGLEEHKAEEYLTLAVNQLGAHSLARVSVSRAGGGGIDVHSLVRYTMLRGDPAGSDAVTLRHKLREAAVDALGDILVDGVDISKRASLGEELAHAKHLLCNTQNTVDEAVLANVISAIEDIRGDHHEALVAARVKLSILQEMLSCDDPMTINTQYDIALWTAMDGHTTEALRLLGEVLAAQERVFGRDSPEALATRNSIATCIGDAGNLRQALQLTRELLPDMERVLGRDHVDTLGVRTNVASWTGEMGKFREALQLSLELLPDQERVLGHDNSITLGTRNNIAIWTGEVGDATGALRRLRDLLQDRERVLGHDHPDTLQTRANIVRWIAHIVERPEALLLSRELLADQERVLGRDHPDTLLTRVNVATFTGQTGDVGAALQLSRELLCDQERVLGHSHPNTLANRLNIALQTLASGNVFEAVRLLRELLPDVERGPNRQLAVRMRSLLIMLRIATFRQVVVTTVRRSPLNPAWWGRLFRRGGS